MKSTSNCDGASLQKPGAVVKALNQQLPTIIMAEVVATGAACTFLPAKQHLHPNPAIATVAENRKAHSTFDLQLFGWQPHHMNIFPRPTSLSLHVLHAQMCNKTFLML